MTTTNQGFEIIHDIMKLRWVPEILMTISMGYSNYSDILNQVEGLSHTELNRKLSLLSEKKAIIKESDHVRSGYILTDFGYDLEHIFKHFLDIAEKYEPLLAD
ncbi:winged helix-turn-helix transcriptional regulator [Petrocella sp. FN5]|uniref:winged helix-turn-helix transcriptional regulator n=1 Tax=Petrocella sp. FN5 TaxID=3032002 RepID=UPI0023DCE109|nr:winged helix-turn-helix transcriptional regulator [Petrocella sp. FN5]MDF1617136.1 winged helix-turn-helix transcriptional regulator [Petrocella sp. FN5]